VSDTLPPVNILGVGAVTPMGRDLEAIARSCDACVASLVEVSSTASQLQQILRVNDDLLINPATANQLRRADRFTRMAVIAATDAWNAAKECCIGITPERIGLIVTSGFGPHCRGFKFLDGILDSGDTAASPTDFSHSVHGAAAAYISRILDIRGPALNITDFEIGFEEAIQIAQCWLKEKACDRILIGAVEELGEVYLWCANRMLDGLKSVFPGEGALFLMLGPNDIPGVAKVDATASPTAVKLLVVEDPAILPSMKNTTTITTKMTVSFTNTFGHSSSAGAFGTLGGLLAMNDAIDTAAIVRTTSEGRTVTLLLEK